MSKHKILSTTVLILLLISLVSGNFPITVKAAPEKLPASPVDESVVPHYFGPYPNWGLSALTNPDVTVTIVGDGSGATATAKVGAGGAITDITITNPGSNYTSATVQITGAGAGAAATAVVTSSQTVVAVNVTNSGMNYVQPSVAITGGGATTPATATAYGSVDSLSLTYGGSGYTVPTVDFDYPDGVGGVQAKGHVIWDTVTGVITGVVIDNPGSGYSRAPNVVIRDGTQFNPLNRRQFNAAQAAREQGILDPQEGQVQSLPRVNVLDNAIVSATINLQSIVVETFGAGYTSVPTVNITDTLGGGMMATAQAVIDIGATAIRLVIAEEEVIACDDEDAALFQAFVEFADRDGEAGEPQPEEEGALAAVHVPLEGIAEGLVGGGAGEAAFFRVEWLHHVAAQLEDAAVFEQREHHLLADARVGKADDGAH